MSLLAKTRWVALRTDYRRRSGTMGHNANDNARVISAGFVATETDGTQWRGLMRVGKLNHGGFPDSRKPLTPTPQDIASIDISHNHVFFFGVIGAGIGYETVDDVAAGGSYSDTRACIQWRSSY